MSQFRHTFPEARGFPGLIHSLLLNSVSEGVLNGMWCSFGVRLKNLSIAGPGGQDKKNLQPTEFHILFSIRSNLLFINLSLPPPPALFFLYFIFLGVSE